MKGFKSLIASRTFSPQPTLPSHLRTLTSELSTSQFNLTGLSSPPQLDRLVLRDRIEYNLNIMANSYVTGCLLCDKSELPCCVYIDARPAVPCGYTHSFTVGFDEVPCAKDYVLMTKGRVLTIESSYSSYISSDKSIKFRLFSAVDCKYKLMVKVKGQGSKQKDLETKTRLQTHYSSLKRMDYSEFSLELDIPERILKPRRLITTDLKPREKSEGLDWEKRGQIAKLKREGVVVKKQLLGLQGMFKKEILEEKRVEEAIVKMESSKKHLLLRMFTNLVFLVRVLKNIRDRYFDLRRYYFYQKIIRKPLVNLVRRKVGFIRHRKKLEIVFVQTLSCLSLVSQYHVQPLQEKSREVIGKLFKEVSRVLLFKFESLHQIALLKKIIYRFRLRMHNKKQICIMYSKRMRELLEAKVEDGQSPRESLQIWKQIDKEFKRSVIGFIYEMKLGKFLHSKYEIVRAKQMFQDKLNKIQAASKKFAPRKVDVVEKNNALRLKEFLEGNSISKKPSVNQCISWCREALAKKYTEELRIFKVLYGVRQLLLPRREETKVHQRKLSMKFEEAFNEYITGNKKKTKKVIQKPSFVFELDDYSLGIIIEVMINRIKFDN